jgi:hypothetical protein
MPSVWLESSYYTQHANLSKAVLLKCHSGVGHITPLLPYDGPSDMSMLAILAI